MNDSPAQYWESIRGPDLAQGDLLESCLVPVFPTNLSPASVDVQVDVCSANLIVITQSCDLVNKKVEFVALCPIYTLDELKASIPELAKSPAREEVRRGRREGLHMLGATDSPEDNRKALVVDFRQIYSLPVGYLSDHAAQSEDRWRLRSPFLEHFSQAFARFFMRVGLPSTIPQFK